MQLDINSLTRSYSAGTTNPAEIIREVYRRIRDHSDKAVWIHLISEQASLARAASLGPYRHGLPLFGIPFAIKDNIDLANVPTTAACPAFTRTPLASAEVVRRLLEAGAIPIGKTNLDQFATGLVGTRSPYGACSSVFDARYISGGSSSGSAVAVAANLVSFSLGTDTAGSGRVPAGFNNIVGLKPTRGALSTGGLVPACRTLDCISVFAINCSDAQQVFNVAVGYDSADPYSRPPGQRLAWSQTKFRVGIPPPAALQFFGDNSAEDLFTAAIRHIQSLGGETVEIDYEPFRKTADLLYAGPWVAERFAAIKDFLAEHPDALHPVTAQIIGKARSLTAVETFEAIYQLADCARLAQRELQRADFLLLPTAGACYTHAEVAADPIQLNTNLGYYTNFVNLLDLAAVAIPAGFRANGIPFGVTLMAAAWSDHALLHTADKLQRCYGPATVSALEPPYCPDGYVPLAVCGAHLSGQPLNRQLVTAGAFLIETTNTSKDYRFYALQGTVPAKPGLVRCESGGAAIEVEVWAIPETTFGAFVAAIPAPLSIGSCTLQSGRTVKSFLCESSALSNSQEITRLGGWRAYLASRQS
jgi:allophanate hydrolase